MKNRIVSVLIAASMGLTMLFSGMPVHAAEWTEEMNYDSNKAFEYIMDKTFDDGITRNDSEYIDHSNSQYGTDEEGWVDPCQGKIENTSSASTATSTESNNQTSTQETASALAQSTTQTQGSVTPTASNNQQSSTQASSQSSSQGSIASSASGSVQTGASTQSAVAGQATTMTVASTGLASAVKITDKEVLKSYPFGAMTVTSPAGVVFTEAVGADGYSFNVFSGKNLVNQALILNAAGAPVKISSPELINVGGKMYINIKAESAASVYATNEQKHAFALFGISGFASNGKVFETFK